MRIQNQMVFLNIDVCCFWNEFNKWGRKLNKHFQHPNQFRYHTVYIWKCFFWRREIICMTLQRAVRESSVHNINITWMCLSGHTVDVATVLLCRSVTNSNSVIFYPGWLHKWSPQFRCRWIISGPTSFSPFVSYVQPPGYDPSMSSFSVW